MFSGFFFVVRHGSILDRIHPVESSGITIGRSEDCGLRLIHDAVSRKHARVERSAQGFLIRDLHSRNGTSVNLCVVASHLLHEFDVVQIAPYSLKVFCDRELAEAEANNVEDSTQSSVLVSQPSSIRADLKQKLIPSLHCVYEGLLDGLCEKDIAQRCGLSKHTVHSYVQMIYQDLDVHSHSELVATSQGHHRRKDEGSAIP